MSTIFRETASQSNNDKSQIDALKDYIENSETDLFNQFDNFPKYVQRTSISRFLARLSVFQMQLEIPGSILDLGVGRGASLFSWGHFSSIFEPVNYTREIIGFDTFQGCPLPAEEDKLGSSSLVREGGFSTEQNIIQDINQAISIYDQNRPLAHLPKIRIVPGDISETLPKFLEDHPHMLVSLLHLDTDMYKPTLTALKHVRERMPAGSIILFDELNNKFYPGETIATLETLGVKDLNLRRFPWATTISYVVL
tara:strand:+ start:1067 stop:1825 length:759 start_codon:yes stop_codon:yes gene_type:complete